MTCLNTRAIHAGRHADPAGAVVEPIVQSSTFRQTAVGQPQGYTYSRTANPTRAAFERRLGALEDAPPAVAFASGLAAISSLFLALLERGDHVVVSDVVYGGTVRLLRDVLQEFGVSATYVDTADPENIRAAITSRTKLVFLETPGNPTLRLADIPAIAAITRTHEIALIVDNTVLTAALQAPLDLGAAVSLYSTTKFVEGHNATIGGAIVSRDAALLERIRFVQNAVGAPLAPFESWLTARGLTTLPLRVRAHSEHAVAVARWLEPHPAVERVHYPGLASFPQHDLAARQHLDHGGLLAFELRGGTDPAIRLLNTVRLCTLAENLGAVETLITHPASMTHGDVDPEHRAAVGITDGLIRLSVGLENPDDIITDLEQALKRIESATPVAVAANGGIGGGA